jgi:hypothetical protein
MEALQRDIVEVLELLCGAAFGARQQTRLRVPCGMITSSI